jgi:hypothetical protein
MDEWPQKLRMIAVLATANVFLARSGNDGWPDVNPPEASTTVSELVAHVLDPDSAPLPKYWNLLFAPTGDLQEIAMSNGWHDTFLQLAEEFDNLAQLLKLANE